MKAKGFKLSAILLVFGAMLLALVGVSIPNKQVAAADAGDSKISYWMLTGDGNGNVERENSGIAAGTTSGYGSYLLGSENVELKTVANEGFDVLEWRIEYIEGGTTKETFLTPTSTAFTFTDENHAGAYIEAQFDDLDKDNLYDESTITISEVFSDLKIEPIFDYTYYKLDASTILPYIRGTYDQLKEKVLTASGIYEEAVHGSQVVTTGAGKNVEKKENVYVDGCFYDEVYEVSIASEKYYYVLQNGKRVDASKGSYILGETVALNFDIHENLCITGNLLTLTYETKNEANEVSVLEKKLTVTQELGTDNDTVFFNKTNGLTNGFVGRAVIEKSYNRTNVLKLDFDYVYKVRIDINLENALVSDETIINALYNVDDADSEDLGIKNDASIQFENFVAIERVGDVVYCYVKNSEDNFNGRKFTVKAYNYNETIDGEQYAYYDFVDIDGEGVNNLEFSEFGQDGVASCDSIQINYKNAEYTVYFRFAVKEFDTVTISYDDEYAIAQTMTLTKGETKNVNTVTPPSFIGYSFAGYATGASVASIQNGIDITIDNTKPSGRTILMVYEKINYQIEIKDYNTISLFNGTSTFYPMAGIGISKNGGNLEQITTFGASVIFTTTASIGDTIELTAFLNDGFTLNSYSVKDYLGDKAELVENKFTFTKESINDYAVGNVITVYLEEDYTEYTITYYMEPASTGADNKVIMADLDCAVPVRAEDVVQVTETTLPNGNVQVLISNLRKFDQITLKSTGKTVTTDDGDYTYVFYMFTEDGISALSSEIDTGITYKHVEAVTRNRSIKVVYSTPKSSLIINITEKYSEAFIYGNLQVSLREGDTVTVLEDDSTTSVIDYNVKLNGIIEIDLGEINFGYAVKGYTTTVGGVSEDVTPNATNNLKCSFTIEAAEAYTLTITFDKVLYKFNVIQNGGGKVDEVISMDLDVAENKTLTFIKPEGYYVNSFFVDGADYSLTNAAVLENNDIINSEYSYELSIDDFKNMVLLPSGQSKAEVNVYITYELHTLSLKVFNVIKNPKNNYNDYYVSFPAYIVIYHNGVQNVAITPAPEDYNAIERSTTIRGIPYGVAPTISLVGGNELGIELNGWTDNSGMALDPSAYIVNGNDLTVRALKANKNLRFNVSYITYTIKTTYTPAQGYPIVLVNGVDKNQITLYDTLSIMSNPNSNGYKFDSIVYNTIVEYTHNPITWATEYANLYVIENGKYVLNESDEYVEGKQYFQKQEVVYNDPSAELTANPFLARQFFANSSNEILFEVNYALRQVVINNISENYNSDKLTVGNLNIRPSDYATYTTIAINAAGETRPIASSDDKVTVHDVVQITIQINGNVKNGAFEEYFDLREGLSLVEDLSSTFDVYYILTTLERGKYVLEFKMSDIMSTVPSTENLDIKYKYFIEKRQLTVITNVVANTDNDDVLAAFNQNVQLAINKEKFGFDSGIATSGAEGYVWHEAQFLAETGVTYQFSTAYNDYIRVYDVVAYKVSDVGGTVELEPITSEFEKYGIEIEKEGNVISSINVRYIYNIQLHLIVTPVVYLEGNEITEGTYIFEREFLCDGDGIAIPQQLTQGSNKYTNYDIKSADIVLNAMTIKYYDNSVVGGNNILAPYNAGVYRVEITFNTTASGYEWLSGLNLPYHILLNINQKEINISYNIAKVERKTREYKKDSSYSVSGLLDYLIFTDNEGFSLSYAQVLENLVTLDSFTLNSNGYRAYTSYTDKGVEVETSQANENTYYNITIVGLELKDTNFNNNFKLLNTELTIRECLKITKRVITVSGINVNDKVYDGTTLATLNSEAELKLHYVYDGDDLYINKDKVLLQFANKDIGADKVVNVNATVALEGEDVGNYTINMIAVRGKTIYPYELRTKVDGVGEIAVYNNRGLTDPTLAHLIPLNATLNVEIIKSDTSQYADIYSVISKYVSRTNVFAVGYRLSLEFEDGEYQNLSKQLYLSIPTVEDLTNVLGLSGKQASKLTYEEDAETGLLLVDLSQLEGEVGDIVLTQRRTLLKLWQIILIVVLSVTAIGTGVTVFIVLRKKKEQKYSVNDKI